MTSRAVGISLYPLAALVLLLLFLGVPPPLRGAMEELEKRVVEETLPNGMKVLILPRHHSPTVSLSMRFLVGSIDEEEGKSGLAHLLEHMMFKGTTALGTKDWGKEKPLRDRIEKTTAALDAERRKGPAGSLERMRKLETDLSRDQDAARSFVVKDEIDSIYTLNGARGLNASTSADLTTFYVSLPSNRLELWARIESARLQDPVMREFYSERDVVVEERRQSFETDPSRKLMGLLLATAYQVHPYRRPVIGWREDVAYLRAPDAASFFRSWYVPNNAVLVIVGDVEPASCLELVKKYFDPIPRGEIPRRHLFPEPAQEGERRAILEMDAQPIVMMAFHKPTLPHEDDYVFDVISSILSDGRTSRLYRSLVEEKQIAVAVTTSNGFPGGRDDNLFLVRAVPRHPHTAAEAEAALLEEIERLTREEVSDKELEKAVSRMRSDTLRSLRSNKGLASLLSYFASHGDWKYVTGHLAKIKDVTAADVRSVAGRYLKASTRTVVTLKTVSDGEEGEESR